MPQRRAILALFLACFLTPQSLPADSPCGSLIVIPDPSAETTAELVRAGLPVLRDMGTFLIVQGKSGVAREIDNRRIDHLVVQEETSGKSYYTVGRRGSGPLTESGRTSDFEILFEAGTDLLIRANPETAESISAAGHDLARLFFRPIRLPAARPAMAKTSLVHDPRIQTLVESVSSVSVDGYVQRLQDFETRYTTHDSCQAAANFIHGEFQSFGIDSVYFHYFDSNYKDNVVAVIPGCAEPDKVVVVGGHYDSITGNHDVCPGADDNASGTSCVLECARVLSQGRFRYTLVFVAFGAEELGLIGSEAYAQWAAQRGDNLIATVAVDMIGYLASGDVMDLDIVSNLSSSWIRTLAVDAGAAYLPGFPIVSGSLPGGAGSDHASFWAAGYDGILFFEDTGNYSPYIHTSSDVTGVSYNSPALAEKSVKVAVSLLATLAVPIDITMDHTPLANTPDTGNAYRLTADIATEGGANPDSLLVRYDAIWGGGEVPLLPTGSANEYEAFIPAQPGGTFVDYYLVAASLSGDRLTHPAGAPAETHRFFVGEVSSIVMDDFETESGWTVGAPDDDATKGIWERVDPNGTWYGPVPVQPEDDCTADPGVTCFVTGNAIPGATQLRKEVKDGKTTLFSPAYDLSGLPNASVRYQRWYSNDTGFNDPEEWVVDVSDDGGAGWTRLETDGRSSHAWVGIELDIADYVSLTSQVQFRFIAADYSYPTIVEAALDEFQIVTYEEAATAVSGGPELPRLLSLGKNSPNPFNPTTNISFFLPGEGAASPVQLSIYDTGGRLVKSLVDGPMRPGRYTITWDGRTDSGRIAASGAYFSRLLWGGEARSRGMVLVR